MGERPTDNGVRRIDLQGQKVRGAAVFGGPADLSPRKWLSLVQLVGGNHETMAQLTKDAGFSSTEKVVLEPEAFKATTPQEFVGLLRLVLERSGMNAGQIAAKTSISRSSAYNLVAANRTGLPRLPHQVLEFLCGCGLQLQQVGQIMRLWTRLEAHRHRGAPALAVPTAKPITQLSPKEIAQEITGRDGPRLRDVPVRDLAREFLRLRTLLPVLAGVVLLLGWRFAASDQPVSGFGVLAVWPCLIGAELLITAATLRWWVRRGPTSGEPHGSRPEATIADVAESDEPEQEDERMRPLQIDAERRQNNTDARDLAKRLNAFYAA
ncbi:hypothetical protein [Amycolatopsis sp. lyj-112]|uniref:hypothetical protein n=1 Tax=Amycolatopsis sp. lyj-112 TaxID=2789288 RepID=UPI00397E82F8